MSSYKSDRQFTDYIHQNLALKIIYPALDWKPIGLEALQAMDLDMSIGIDYVFMSDDGRFHTVQERFREKKYENYTDFTIRYRRDQHHNEKHHRSEYFKMKADYFIYAITNGNKKNLASNTDLLKYAIIYMRPLYEKFDQELIRITSAQQPTSYIEGQKLICPVKHNKDGSSSFLPIDIPSIISLWGNDVVLAQKGFF